MKINNQIVGAVAVIAAASLALPAMAQEEKKAEPAKAKAEKVSGDMNSSSWSGFHQIADLSWV